jgi:hypothetical protein
MNRDSCRYQLNRLGYFWKIDSLGGNGLRLYVVDRLLSCNLNDITEEELFNNLGKPNIVRPLNAGIDYVYYYYDGKLFMNKPEWSHDQMYIVFRFLNSSKYLYKISDGVSE